MKTKSEKKEQFSIIENFKNLMKDQSKKIICYVLNGLPPSIVIKKELGDRKN